MRPNLFLVFDVVSRYLNLMQQDPFAVAGSCLSASAKRWDSFHWSALKTGWNPRALRFSGIRAQK
jgi:hypothetical protein